jgi:hypothetical protein
MRPTFEYFTFWDGGQEDKRLVASTCQNVSSFLISSWTVPNFCFQNVWTDTCPRIYEVSESWVREVLCCVLPSDHGIWNYFTADRPLNSRIRASRWRYFGVVNLSSRHRTLQFYVIIERRTSLSSAVLRLLSADGKGKGHIDEVIFIIFLKSFDELKIYFELK